MSSLLLLLLLLAFSVPVARAGAQDRVSLAEILPSLDASSDLRTVDVGAAPLPGTDRVVRRSEVLRAIREAGFSVPDVAIPSATRVHRNARHVEGDELRAIATRAIEERVGACAVADVVPQGAAVVSDGELTASIELPDTRGADHVSGVLVLTARGVSTRIGVRARIDCGPPVVQPGAVVRAVARAGAVVASVQAVARQQGRVGDLIRVESRLSRAPLRARVVSAELVEVVR